MENITDHNLLIEFRAIRTHLSPVLHSKAKDILFEVERRFAALAAKETGINKAHLASRMKMPPGTFKNKLSDKQDKYRFTEEEEARLIEILKDIAETIEIRCGISFNRALATIVK